MLVSECDIRGGYEMKKRLLALVVCMSLVSICSMSFASDPIEPVKTSIAVPVDYSLVKLNQK